METLKVYNVVCESVYTEPFQITFQVEDSDAKAAKEFAEQCICAGKEKIIAVLESA